MTDLTTAQKRKLIRELDKASALHKGQANLLRKNLAQSKTKKKK